jgi:hypothetical protein
MDGSSATGPELSRARSRYTGRSGGPTARFEEGADEAIDLTGEEEPPGLPAGANSGMVWPQPSSSGSYLSWNNFATALGWGDADEKLPGVNGETADSLLPTEPTEEVEDGIVRCPRCVGADVPFMGTCNGVDPDPSIVKERTLETGIPSCTRAPEGAGPEVSIDRGTERLISTWELRDTRFVGECVGDGESGGELECEGKTDRTWREFSTG